MFRRVVRSLPAVGAVLAVGVFSAGTVAFAGGPGSDHHGSGGHHQSSRDSHGDRGHHYFRGDHRRSCRWVSAWDQQWLKMHIETNLFEIAGGRAALEKATTDPVRQLAGHLVQDHTAALEEAVAVAERLGLEVPQQPAPLQQWALRAVAQFSGSAFDRWFADLQVEGHKQAIALAQAEASKGCNPKVRGLAAKSLPVLEAHLEHALPALDATQ